LKPETKTVDTDVYTTPLRFDTNSVVANTMRLVNTIPVGNSCVSRIGKKVTLKALAIRGAILSNTATTQDRVSLLLVWIRNPNQAANLPAWTEILTAQSSYAMNNRDNASKFKIVRRWDYAVIGNTTTPQSGMENIPVDEYVTFKKDKYVSCWTQASVNGTINEFEQGALILCSVGTNAYGATTTAQLYANTRLYFQDV